MKTTLLAAAISGIVAGSAGMATARADNLDAHRTAGEAGSKKPSKDAKKDTGKHACKGQNGCQGQGGCKTEKHACKGQNACKGQGGCKG